MIIIADISEYKNGRKKVTFFELGIYDFLKRSLGFRYSKINGKGYYLQKEKGIYKEVNFIKLRDEFTKYLEQEFNNLEISKKIDFESFINEYYKKSPIKNGDFARTYLREDFEIDDPYLSL